MEKKETLKFHGIVIIVLLILQYLLGMITNLFVQFPQDKHGGQLWVFAWKQIPLAAHIILGILLIIGSIVLVIRAMRQKNKSWIIASIIGVLSILVAGVSGAIFIPSQAAIYSFIMSISFIAAFISYGWGIYVSKN